MLPRLAPALLTLTGSLIAVPVAGAGTISLDRSCYVERTAMVIRGTAFTPGAHIVLSGNGVFGQADADATGAFVTTLQVPTNPNAGMRSSDVVNAQLKAENSTTPADNTAIGYQVTNAGFSVSDSAGNPRKKRTFYFAGFPTGSTVWGHYRFAGKTLGNVKFGKSKGACGLLSSRQALLPSSVPMRYGNWKIQWDNARKYKATRKPRVSTTLTTYRTFRPR